MAIIIFIAILLGLIVAHELGHFFAAKRFGIKVEEFGVGFPPKLFGVKHGETEYTFNLLPFGGFVRIFGESEDALKRFPGDAHRSFMRAPRLVQLFVLSAGVLMNVIAAWFLLSVGYMVGLPSEAGKYNQPLSDAQVTVIAIAPGSPAEAIELVPGERLVKIETVGESLGEEASASDVRTFIAAHGEEELTLTLSRGDTTRTVSATPTLGITPEGRALGVVFEDVGLLRLPVHLALLEGAKLTVSLTKETAVGLYTFFVGIVRGTADFAAIAGPVGIVGVVDEASSFGVAALIMLAAVISINLAIINLLPFPALDGGRIVMVVLEAIRGRAFSQATAAWTNGLGFLLLIILMVVITYHDIVKLF